MISSVDYQTWSNDDTMNNSKHQISVRLPQALYLSLQDYIGKHEFLNLTQVTIYALAKYIGHTEPMNNSVALEIDDLKIDVQDIESFLENLDRRLTKIEKKHQPKQDRVPHRLTDSQKYSIIQYVKKCLNSDSPIIIKEVLYYLGLDLNHQGLQQQVAHILKTQNLMKARRKINNKVTSVWIERNK